jgi:hypothetical protein
MLNQAAILMISSEQPPANQEANNSALERFLRYGLTFSGGLAPVAVIGTPAAACISGALMRP